MTRAHAGSLSGRVVHRGYVNPWECDEMGHMNLQFHAAKFSDALAHLVALADVPLPRIDHLHFRFSHELRTSDLVSIRAAALTQDRARLTLQFLMANGSDVLASSQIAELSCADERDAARLAALAGESAPHVQAQPRAIDAAIFTHAPSLDLVQDAPRFESNRGIIHASDCTGAGEAGVRTIMARISEAQAHMWQAADIGRHWQVQENLATASAELGMRFHGVLRAGEPFFITTSFHAAGSKMMRFSHHLFHALSGAPILAAEGAAVLIDRTTRRAVPLPERARKNPSL